MSGLLEEQPLLRRSATKTPGIDLTALVDITFILLIFFMVSTRFANPVLDVDLPEAESKQVHKGTGVVLTIKSSSRQSQNPAASSDLATIYQLGSRQLTLQEVQGALQSTFKEQSSRAVIIRADKQLPLESFIQGLAAVRKAGASSVEIEHR